MVLKKADMGQFKTPLSVILTHQDFWSPYVPCDRCSAVADFYGLETSDYSNVGTGAPVLRSG